MLNQRAQTLTKAIALQEGGGKYLPYTAHSGDVPNATQAGGRYQFMPNTWNKYAGQVLGDPNAPMTPENQNKVAYTKVSNWLQKGYTPAQVASMWNAGEGSPNSWKPGTQQAVGNTPEYVRGVQKYGQQLTGQGVHNLPKSVMSSTPQNNTQGIYNLPKAVVPKSVQPTQIQMSQKPSGFLNTLDNIGKGAYGALTNLEKPFIGVASIPTQLLAKSLGKPDPFAQGIPNVEPAGQISPLNLEKKAGDLAQVGSYFVPGLGESGLLARLGATAGMGALQGAGQAMSQGKGALSVAGEGVFGAGIGATTAGLSDVVGRGLQKLGNGLTGAETNKAIGGLKNTYEKILNLNVTNRRFENRTGKDLAQVLVENQAPLSRNADGTLNADTALTILRDKLAPLNEKVTQMLQNPQGDIKSVSLSDVLKNAVEKIKQSRMTSSQIDKSINNVNKEMQAEINRYGSVVNPETSDKIKQAFWNETFKAKLPSSAEKLNNNVFYVIGKELKNAEEKAVSKSDVGVGLKEINSQRSDLIDSIKRLSDLNGVNLIRGGRVGNIATGLAGAVIGTHTGGLLGGITGDYLGNEASKFLNDPATMLAIQRMKYGAVKKGAGLLGRFAKPIGKLSAGLGTGLRYGATGAGLLNSSQTSNISNYLTH